MKCCRFTESPRVISFSLTSFQFYLSVTCYWKKSRPLKCVESASKLRLNYSGLIVSQKESVLRQISLFLKPLHLYIQQSESILFYSPTVSFITISQFSFRYARKMEIYHSVHERNEIFIYARTYFK